MPDTVHPAARELLLLAVDHHWNASLVYGVDSGNSPFVTVNASHADHLGMVSVTWHTRSTGTYRLFSAMDGRRDRTLTQVRELLAGAS